MAEPLSIDASAVIKKLQDKIGELTTSLVVLELQLESQHSHTHDSVED